MIIISEFSVSLWSWFKWVLLVQVMFDPLLLSETLYAVAVDLNPSIVDTSSIVKMPSVLGILT